MIRERAACGLAQSGMFSREQRLTAVPRLLDYAEDGALDAETRKWVFQALRDITGQTLPHDAAAWRQRDRRETLVEILSARAQAWPRPAPACACREVPASRPCSRDLASPTDARIRNDYAGLRAGTADGSASRPCARARRLGAIVIVLWTSLALGIAQAISPTSRFSRFCDTVPVSVIRPPSLRTSTSLAPGTGRSRRR